MVAHPTSTDAPAATFSRTDTTFFKGIGILLIVTHNFFHVRKGFGIENEMEFKAENIHAFLGYLAALDFDSGIAAIFSFLGHYGVQLFIFFSAYGLSVQYQRHRGTDLEFIVHRLRKIYFLLAFGIVFYVAAAVLAPRQSVDWLLILRNTFLLGTTISSFSMEWKYQMFAGPFWFFALIIQLYLLFPWLYRVSSGFVGRSVWVPFLVSYLLIYAGFLLGGPQGFSTFSTLIGHLPEVLLGVWLARSGTDGFARLDRLPWHLLCILLFALSQLHPAFFPLGFLCITILLLSSVRWLQPRLGRWPTRFVLFCGEISMIMFVVNARVRGVKVFDAHTVVDFVAFMPVLLLLSYLLYRIYHHLVVRWAI